VSTESTEPEFCWQCGAAMPGDHDIMCPLAPPSVEAIRRRIAAASPGPWSVSTDSCDCGGGCGCSHGDWPYAIHGPVNQSYVGKSGSLKEQYGKEVSEISELSDADADFIANARRDVEYLLSLVDVLAVPVHADGAS
jgi:hypothetical protein